MDAVERGIRDQRKRTVRWIVIATLAAALVAVPPAPAVPDEWSPSETAPDGSRLHTYEDLLLQLQALEAAGARVEVPETSQGGRDIAVVAIGNGPYTFFVTGAIHANEPTGTEAILRLAWMMLGDLAPTFADAVLPGFHEGTPIVAAFADPEVRARVLSQVTFVAIPMVDPDGVANNRTREPFYNTDYATQATPQSRAIAHVIESYHPDFFLDQHGGPDAPEINFGVIELQNSEPALIAEQRRMIGIAWQASSATGAGTAYFEELILETFGLDGEPFASVDSAFWDLPSRYGPVAQTSWQLRGVPSSFTESVGLQSVDPIITLSEGAGIQQVTMMAHALYGAGLLTGETFQRSVTPVGAASSEIPVALPGGRVFISLDWAGVSDYAIALHDSEGQVIAERGPLAALALETPLVHGAQNRALRLDDVPAGDYTIQVTKTGPATPVDAARLKIATWTHDGAVSALDGILDPDAPVQYGSSQASLYDELDPIPKPGDA